MNPSKIKYDICIIITTYNRQEMLKLLLDDIFNDTKYKKLVIVLDDASTDVYDLKNYDVKYIKYVKNNGLKKLWSVINDTFKICKQVSADYYFYLQDDVRLKENFFDESLRIFNKINDEKKISLGTLMVESQRNQPKWTSVQPIEFDEYYKTQWVELFFVCKYNFFEVLNFEMIPIDKNRWALNENLSSGVGEQLSRRLHNMGLGLYHTINSLVTHGSHESVILPELRKKQKLIAI